MTTRAVSLQDPYAWQAEALAAWRKAKRRGIVEAVTGTGKTFIGVAAAGEALHELRRVAVLVPTRELQQQWYRKLTDHLPDVRIGLRGNGEAATLQTHPVVVSIINSAREGALEPPADSLLIADECHRYAAATNFTALSPAFEHRLGLTATLERPDQLEDRLKEYLGSVVFTMGYAQAIADEVTAHLTVGLVGLPMSPGERAQYDGLSKALADSFSRLVQEFGFATTPFHKFMREVGEAAQSDDNPACGTARAFQSAMHKRRQLLAIAPTKIDFVSRLADAIWAADRALVFTDSIDTAERVRAGLADTGLRVASLHSEHGLAERADHLRRFAAGYLDAVVAPRVLDEGVDVPEADLAIIVAGSNTRRQMVQRMGRVLRRKSDGRLARLGILYLEETTEDPKRGAHETFLGEVLEVADDYKLFNRSQVVEATDFLSAFEPLSEPLPPRREGEPLRHVAATSDEALPVDAVLGLPSPPSLSSPRSKAPERPEQRLSFSNGATADARSQVRSAYRAAHRFISKSEARDFEEQLDHLLSKFGLELMLDAVRTSPLVSEIAAKATSRVEFEERTKKSLEKRQQAGNRRKPKRKKSKISPQAKPSPTKKATSRAPGAAPTYERPLYRPSAGPVRRCRSCGAPEQSCRC